MSTSRLRKFRKSANLTQKEVAALVGYKSQRAYSDMELGLKRPALGTALTCCTLFKASLLELFPAFAESNQRDLLARARQLHKALAKDGSRSDSAAFLAEMIDRLGRAQ